MINGIDCHRDNTAASHMPILMEFIELFKPQNVIEFGSGNYSTKLFLEKIKYPLSCEMSNRKWFAYMQQQMKNINQEWVYEWCSYEEAKENIYKRELWDIGFVDDGDMRAPLANDSFGNVDTIICHDSQASYSDGIEKTDEYKLLIFKKFPIEYGHNAGKDVRPWTSLYTRNCDVFNYFSNIDEETLYEKYKFPYVWRKIPERAF